MVVLVVKYGGLMWGEYGKGFCSEYGLVFFGELLFIELRWIKIVFDLLNKMNLGKICMLLDSIDELVCVSDLKCVIFDRIIFVVFKDVFKFVMECNGNGLCFNYDMIFFMCLFSKIIKDCCYSLKGRVGFICEWVWLLVN